MENEAGMFASVRMVDSVFVSGESIGYNADLGKGKYTPSSVCRSLSDDSSGQGNSRERRQGLCSGIWFLFFVFQSSHWSNQDQGADNARKPHEMLSSRLELGVKTQ